MIQVEERIDIAQEVLDTHAEKLKTEFVTFEEAQGLFIDVFGNNLDSSNNLSQLQNEFVNGTLRPEVKFVSSKTLTDAEGNSRGAAFDGETQTILLSEDLSTSEIESSIEQELGHWWDVQLNGTKDTKTADGRAFDEGTAYAERFAEGADGDNIFSDLVYQTDFHTVMVDGQETEVEFRNIATWNIQGATNNGESTWEEVFDVMNSPEQGQEPIEVMAIQEAGNPGQALGIEPTSMTANFVRYDLERGGEMFRIYWTLGGMGQNERNLATVVRNPSTNEDAVNWIPNPTNPGNRRPILGVVTGGNIYYNVHAAATMDNNNDSEAILDYIYNDPGLQTIHEEQNIDTENIFVLGDFNRNIANDNDPVGEVDNAYGEQRWRDALIRPDTNTQNARSANPTNTLDYMFSEADLLDDTGRVINFRPDANTPNFPSDHFPVFYDDAPNITSTPTPDISGTPTPSITGEPIGLSVIELGEEPSTETATVGTGTEFDDLILNSSSNSAIFGDGPLESETRVNIDIDGEGNVTAKYEFQLGVAIVVPVLIIEDTENRLPSFEGIENPESNVFGQLQEDSLVRLLDENRIEIAFPAGLTGEDTTFSFDIDFGT